MKIIIEYVDGAFRLTTDSDFTAYSLESASPLREHVAAALETLIADARKKAMNE